LSSITKSCLGKEYTSSNLNDLALLIALDEFHDIIKFTQRFVEKLLEQVNEQQNNKRHFIIDKVVEYVNENYHLPICVEETAQKFSLSPFYFSKLFKEYQNINFVDFITEIRIKKAIELFANESLNIKEIAYQVGYRDANYFSRVFKKMIGMSPKDYRNKFFI
ncbi:MAG: AraC family transcriptional regulator, partial [Clostridiaceae bacterium]